MFLYLSLSAHSDLELKLHTEIQRFNFYLVSFYFILFQPLSVYISFCPRLQYLVLFVSVSLRFSWPVHQWCAADAVAGARGSSGVSVWAAVASGSVCNSGVIPPLHLPLHPILLGTFPCSRFGGQHRWELSLIIKRRTHHPKLLFKKSYWSCTVRLEACFIVCWGFWHSYGWLFSSQAPPEPAGMKHKVYSLFQVSWAFALLSNLKRIKCSFFTKLPRK